MDCANYKLQYVGKTETELNVRIKNHRRDVLKLNAIPADRHFAQADHDLKLTQSLLSLNNCKTQS